MKTLVIYDVKNFQSNSNPNVLKVEFPLNTDNKESLLEYFSFDEIVDLVYGAYAEETIELIELLIKKLEKHKDKFKITFKCKYLDE